VTPDQHSLVVRQWPGLERLLPLDVTGSIVRAQRGEEQPVGQASRAQTDGTGEVDDDDRAVTTEQNVLVRTQVEVGQAGVVQATHHFTQPLQVRAAFGNAIRRVGQQLAVDPLHRNRIGIDTSDQIRNTLQIAEPTIGAVFSVDLDSAEQSCPPGLSCVVLDQNGPTVEFESKKIGLQRKTFAKNLGEGELAPGRNATRYNGDVSRGLPPFRFRVRQGHGLCTHRG